LAADNGNWGAVNLCCVKNRHGDTPELLLNFDRARQSFTVTQRLAPNTSTGTDFSELGGGWNDEPEE
jgi:hypothetical protein